MAHAKFPCEVLTPGQAFNDEVEQISTRTTLGLIAILANHAPVLARLEPTELRLYRSESEILRYAQGEGFMQRSENHALLLVEEITPLEDLDRGALEEARDHGRQALDAAEADSEAAARAERQVRRAEVFLAILDAE